MKMRSGTECLGLDQLGEALLPLALFASLLSLNLEEIAVVTIVFSVLDIAVTRLRHPRWLG